ncbi:MAG: pro-sigmaK processing inhibitor BofA family protein [Clostridiales bacterium]|nr:pro-sigmaK processing inhibitor BofA family protein [Clostridiales bacterium]
MEKITAFQIMAGMLLLVLGIVLLKQKSQIVWNFLVRSVLGAICILFTNDFLAAQGIAVAVGLNPVSLLTVGTLGFGGFSALYGILFTQFL